MRDQTKSWSEMCPLQRKAVVAGGVVELLITAVAARDLHRRDRTQVRGPKPVWVAAFAVQPLGPIGYLLFGRK